MRVEDEEILSAPPSSDEREEHVVTDPEIERVDVDETVRTEAFVSVREQDVRLSVSVEGEVVDE